MTRHRSADPFLPRRRQLLGAGVAAFALLAAGKSGRVRAAPQAFDAFVREQMRAADMPGLALGVAHGGAVQLARGYGYANIERRQTVTADTVFHVASLTKTVTATAILQLAEEGKLALDQPVAAHLDFALSNPNHPDAPITFRQLLMHTSSLSDAKYYEIDFRQPGRDATLPLRDFLQDYLVAGGRNYSKEKCFSTTAPGSAWEYSNVGYGLLGYLATRIGGEDLRERSRRRLFAPLGMRHTYWTLAETSAASCATPYDRVDGKLVPVQPLGSPDWGSSMVRSSIADFTRFVAASANGGASGDARILRAETVARMLDMQKPNGLPDWLSGQGLGWMASPLDGATRPNHWGGDPGVFTAAYLDPANRSGVVLLGNATASPESKAAVKAIASRALADAARVS